MGALYNDIEDYAVELLNLRINDGLLMQAYEISPQARNQDTDGDG